ncbi:MAG TPA: acylphosphatase [Candidatus Thermoplasmatota archaeon]|nr:acylphosphatase [Candidatus Thermoplasmatota archaeon]
MSKKTVHVYIRGKVQGVWFRANTKEEAEKKGVHGWVRNMSDGRVEALFEGEHKAVDAMVEWCHRGSPLSNVKNVKVQEMSTPVGCLDFKIKH